MADAQYYAGVTGADGGLGMQSRMMDLGVKTQVGFRTDSKAAKTIASG